MKSKGGDSKAKGAACPKTEMKSPERMFPRRQKRFSRSRVLGGGKKGAEGKRREARRSEECKGL